MCECDVFANAHVSVPSVQVAFTVIRWKGDLTDFPSLHHHHTPALPFPIQSHAPHQLPHMRFRTKHTLNIHMSTMRARTKWTDRSATPHSTFCCFTQVTGMKCATRFVRRQRQTEIHTNVPTNVLNARPRPQISSEIDSMQIASAEGIPYAVACVAS